MSLKSTTVKLSILDVLAFFACIIGLALQILNGNSKFIATFAVATIAIQVYFERTTRQSSKHALSGKRKKHRPRRLDFSNALPQNGAPTIVPYQSPIFQTPAIGQTFYDDPSITHRHLATQAPEMSLTSPQTSKLRAFSSTMESQLGPLPSGWELRLSANMRVFFVNNAEGVTTWQDPRLPVPEPELVIQDGYESPNQAAAGDFQGMCDSPCLVRWTACDRARVTEWIEAESRKLRARDARVNTLRRRARMAKYVKLTQPLDIDALERPFGQYHTYPAGISCR